MGINLRAGPFNYEFIFVFLGQLPQPYDITNLQQSTRLTRPETFNDQNKQEVNRFVNDPTKECHYMVDQVVHPDDQTELEPNFGLSQPNVWKEEFSLEFLDSKRSHPFFRAFYIPFYSPTRCTYNNYTLYKNVSPGLLLGPESTAGRNKHKLHHSQKPYKSTLRK